MTPNVLEICFQQTATFQKQTYFFNKTITHWFQEVPSRSLMQSLQFPQSLSSSLKVSQVLSKTVSQVPSRFLKFFQTVPQVSSGSLRSLRVSQGPSRSLRVPQNVSRSSWIKKLIKPQGITSQQDGTHTSLRTSALYHKHFDMICFHIVYPSKNRVVLWSQFQMFSKIQGRTLTKKMKIKGRSLIETRS